MNIAFPALLIFVLALPGSILTRTYREWGWKLPVYRLPLGEEIAQSVFTAAVLHWIWCLGAARLGYQVAFRDVLLLLVGGSGLPGEFVKDRLNAIAAQSLPIAAYFGSLYFGAAIIGIGGHQIVRKLHLDWRHPFLRFENFWHYALNAELPLFGENREAFAERAMVSPAVLKDQEVLVRISCVVNHGSGSYVYEGTPRDYFFDRSGGLEKILLEDVTYEKLYDFSSARSSPTGRASLLPRIRAGRPERDVSADEGGEAQVSVGALPLIDSVFSIESHVFVLNAADAHNIGIEYIYLPEESHTTDSGVDRAAR
jgi:hypothetical protein